VKDPRHTLTMVVKQRSLSPIVFRRTTTWDDDPQRDSFDSCTSTDSAFSCSNIIPKHSPPKVAVYSDITYILYKQNVCCVPPYPNHILLGQTAEYIPCGWDTPITVRVQNIEGHGALRDVELIYHIPRDAYIETSIEHGILLFHASCNGGPALRYRPSRLYLATRALRDSFRRWIGKISLCPDGERVIRNSRIVMPQEIRKE
jgi:hypothetical protein